MVYQIVISVTPWSLISFCWQWIISLYTARSIALMNDLFAIQRESYQDSGNSYSRRGNIVILYFFNNVWIAWWRQVSSTALIDWSLKSEFGWWKVEETCCIYVCVCCYILALIVLNVTVMQTMSFISNLHWKKKRLVRGDITLLGNSWGKASSHKKISLDKIPFKHGKVYLKITMTLVVSKLLLLLKL